MAAVEFEHFGPEHTAIETPFADGVFLNLERKSDDEIEVYMSGPADPEDDEGDAVLVLRLSAAGKRQLREWLA